MSGTLRGQNLLSAILTVATCPTLQKLPPTQRANFGRSFTNVLSRRASSRFSVSFAPEPDEPATEAPTQSNTPDNKAKREGKAPGKSKSARENTPHKDVNRISNGGSKGSPDNAQAIAKVESTRGGSQNHETHVYGTDKQKVATTNVYETADPPVELGPKDDLLIPDGLTAEPPDSEGYPNAVLGGEGQAERTISGVPAKEKKTKMRQKKSNPESLVGSRSVIDERPIKPQTPLNLSHTETLPIPDGVKPGMSDSHSTLKNPTSKSSKVDSKPSTRTPAKPPRASPVKKEPWQAQRQALQKKFGSEGWNPRKKLSPDTLDGIRALNDQYPDKYTTPVLAEKFKVSPEAIRRILKSKWRPDPAKQAERRERWARRHDQIWDQQAAIGLRPARTKIKKPKEAGELDAAWETEEVHAAGT